jgi:isoleucyl-tRNA synthetase
LLTLERGGEVHVTAGGETHPVTAEDLTIERRASGTYVVHQDGARFAAIDPAITDALRSEGLAREVVSRVQRLRKEMGFAVSDRIILGVAGSPAVEAAVRLHEGWIAGEVLATRVSVGSGAVGPDTVPVDLDGAVVRLTLTRMSQG